MVRKWVRMFNEGRENVHDDARSGRPSLVNDDLVRKVNERVRDDRRFTISDLSLHFPQISRTLLSDTVSSHLGRRRPHSIRRAHKNLCPAKISASITAAHMWKNSFKNVESDNNKILYKTLIVFLQRNGTYFLNKPRSSIYINNVEPPINSTPPPYLGVIWIHTIPLVTWAALTGVEGYPDGGYYDTGRLTGFWSTQTKMKVIVLKAACHLGRDSSVVNDPLGEPGRIPLYVGFPPTWGSKDGDRMFSPFSREGSFTGDSAGYE